nr:Gag-Pol polyprotein [Tanacetum cinerariifolium]
MIEFLRTQADHTKATDQIIESVHWKRFDQILYMLPVYVLDTKLTPPKSTSKRFSDVDYAGCKDTFKSNSGGAQFLGEKLVSWSSKKQDCTSLSIAKLEYVSLSACCAQVLWMRT